MKSKEILTIIAIIILALIGGYLLYQYSTTEQLPREPASYGTEVITPKTDRVYTNPLIGFGFRYPSDYEVTSEILVDMSEERSTRIYELALTLEDTNRPGTPQLNLYINKTIPTERAERTLTFVQDDVGVYIAEIFEDKTLDDERVRTIGSIVMSDDNVYTWEFLFERGAYDYGPELEAMLATFGIYVQATAEEEVIDSEAELN